MTHSFFLFNPDHDLALANGDENFHSPLSAQTFAKDLACFPMWFAPSGSRVMGAMPYREWMEEMKCLFPQIAQINVSSKTEPECISSVHPWGWNAAICKRFRLSGVSEELLPSIAQIAHYRQLSHRQTAIRAMEFLQQHSLLKNQIPAPASLLSSGEIEDFASLHPSVVFKAPWSSSGKGICWASGALSDSVKGWCRNVAEKQGAVVAEKAYDKVQDFAIEFSCEAGSATFAGYSLFQTERGVYKSNELMSDNAIFDRLKQWISPEVLLAAQKGLQLYIEEQIAPYYNGFLGVDLFVYADGNRFLLHPCVEINLRMTMGMVARVFFDRFVSPDQTGKFYIDHFPKTGDLLLDHQSRQNSMPLSVSDGRIISGYLSLSPISKNSHYRARIEV